MEKNTTTLWRLTKLLNEDNQEKRQTVIESQNEHLTQKRATNCFAHMYLEECTVKLPRERTRHVRNSIKKQLSENIPADGCMTDAIQKDELEVEIRTLKTKKAPGPEGVTHDMILYLGPSAKKAILTLCNKSWSQAPFQLCGKRPQ